MNMEQELLYLGTNYKILCAEQEFLIHPAAFGLIPLSTDSLQNSFIGTFQIKGYHLMLDRLTINFGETEKQYAFEDFTVAYNGAILIGANQVKEYNMKVSKMTSFSYQSVFELVFDDGILTTTIDQSKAMSRIRKNIELGFRDLLKGRDVRCIKRFINSSLVGDYKTFKLINRRFKYLKEMKSDYQTTNLIKQIDSIE